QRLVGPAPRPQLAANRVGVQSVIGNPGGHHARADRILVENPAHRSTVTHHRNPSLTDDAAKGRSRHADSFCDGCLARVGHYQRSQLTVTTGEPLAVDPSVPDSLANRIASSINVSTICASGTVLMTSPRTKICPLPLPDATPRSASRASPG